MASPCPLYSKG